MNCILVGEIEEGRPVQQFHHRQRCKPLGDLEDVRMRKHSLGIYIVVLILLLSSLLSAWGYPSASQPQEPAPRKVDYRKLALEIYRETNLMRASPARYAETVLKPMRQHFKDNLYEPPGEIGLMTEEGVAALDEAIAALKAVKGKLPALVWSEALARAAAGHANDADADGHTGSDGSTMDERIGRYLKEDEYSESAENIASNCYTAREVVSQLLIDDGVADRGHRENLLNPTLNLIGVGCGRKANGELIAVMDYAAKAQPQPTSAAQKPAN
jgi:uncharacterized protein YkwD